MGTDISFVVFNEKKEYASMLELQEKTREEVIAKKHNGVIFFLEHEDVYTVGLRGKDNDFKDISAINRENIPVVKIRRGGEVTWHGPGQLIIYPVINFRKAGFRSIKEFVSFIGNSIADVLRNNYGISSARWSDDKPGVWVDDRKIAFVGLHFRKFVPVHGFSLNLDPDINRFSTIIPCGIPECKITSIFNETGTPVRMEEVCGHILDIFKTGIPDIYRNEMEGR